MFCSKCGNRLEDESRFCNKCGSPITSTTSDYATTTSRRPAPETALIKIQMEPEPMLFKLGKMEVWMDGRMVNNELFFGKTVEISVHDMGWHSLQVTYKVLWTLRSELLPFQISPNQVLNFEAIYSHYPGTIDLVQL